MQAETANVNNPYGDTILSDSDCNAIRNGEL
jgi:hypothetical protein